MSAAKVVVGLIGSGIVAVLVWVLVIEPRGRRGEAQKAIAEWEADWSQVRRCIAGDQPLAQDPAENLALLQYTDFEARRRLERCRQLIARLRPPPGDDSGVPEIEDGWKRTVDNVAKLNASIADYAADAPSKALGAIRADIAARLASVDESYAGLRSAAGLAKVAWPQGGAPPLPPLPAGLEIVVGGNQAIRPARAVIDGQVIEVWGETGGGPALALVDGPSPGLIREVPLSADPMLQAVDLSAGWGVRAQGDAGTVVIETVSLDSAGALDESKKPVVVTKVPAPGPDLGADVTVLAAAGSGQDRVVVYEVQRVEGGSEVLLARSKNAGATWAAAAKLAENATTTPHQDWARGRVDLIISADDDGGRVTSWLGLDAVSLTGALRPTPLDLDGADPATALVVPCVGKDVVWLAAMTRVLRLPLRGDGAPLGLERPPASEVAACSDQLLVSRAFGVSDMTVVSCDKERCELVGRIPWSKGAEVSIVAGAKLGASAVVLADGYLLTWQRGPNGVLVAKPRFRAPDGASLFGAVEWDGVVHGLVMIGDRARLVPLPN
jgi:hypothetical protein